MHDLISKKSSPTIALALLSMGIVFGDIGTSPLYTLQSVFDSSYNIALTESNIVGACSCIFWALMIIVTLKYVTFILRATNKGEGGIIAMLALVSSATRRKPRIRKTMIMIGLIGAALFYGDAIITPSISVLSAIEGLNVASPNFQSYTVVISVVIIIGLFLFQRYGTEFIGRFFAPICIIWFISIGIIGINNIIDTPQILSAFNPIHAFRFVTLHGFSSFLVLGAVLLAFTGAEALYADVGHFGQKAIRLAWFMIFPTLVLSYFGQGALLIHSPEAVANPFYMACPSWALYPMVILATLATIIASQAVISGTYSITSQAIKLRFLPRMKVVHTSTEEKGQIYMPVVNWILLMVILITIVSFGSSTNLASAYGLAVAGTMLITSILSFFVVRYDWKYSLWLSLLITVFFISIDVIFLSASLFKISHGGWLPLLLGMVMLLIMRTWSLGRNLVDSRRKETTENLNEFLKKLLETSPLRIPGTSVFLYQAASNVPPALLYNLKHNKILHRHVVFLTLSQKNFPFINDRYRLKVKKLQPSCYHLTLRFGFNEEPNIPKALNLCSTKKGFSFLAEEERSFFLSYETLLQSNRTKNMMSWRKRLFIILAQNQRSIPEYFHLPSEQVIQLGAQIEI